MHEIFTIESDSQSKISLHPGKVIRTHFLHIWDWLKVYPSYKDIFLLQGTRFSLEAMIGKKKTKKKMIGISEGYIFMTFFMPYI